MSTSKIGQVQTGDTIRCRSIVAFVLVLTMLLPPLAPAHALMRPEDRIATERESITVDFDTVLTVPEEIREPIIAALKRAKRLLPDADAFTVTALRVSEPGEWIHVVLVPGDVIDAGWTITIEENERLEILGRRTANGQYDASLEGSEGYAELVSSVPKDFIDFEGSGDIHESTMTTAFLFPWTNGQEWFKLRDPGWHSGYGSYAIDFQPVVRVNPSTDYVVLASEGGSLWEDCNDGYQSLLRISHSGGETKYLHVDVNSVPRNLIGQTISRGQFLGLLYDGDAKTAGNCNGWTGCKFHTPCGYGTATHLHFVVSDPNMTIEGRTANSIAYAAHATRYNSTNTRTDGGGQSGNCADGEGAVLFEHSGHTGRCTRFTGNDGYIGDDAIGNDAASSIRIIGNFEAIVHEHDNYTGSNSQFSGDDSDLGNDAIGNDRASSIQVRRRDAGGSSNCDGGEGVYLYEHSNYGGNCSKFTGDAPNPRNWYIGNDAASSIRIVGSYEASVYEHDDYNGGHSTFSGDDPDFGDDSISHDRASSIQVRRSGGGSSNCDGGEGVYLYEHANHDGKCSKFTEDTPNPRSWYIGNDTASSIRIVGSYEASVYEHDDYNGVHSTFSGDDADFGNDTIGHDRASSIRVTQGASGPTSCDDDEFLAEYFNNRDLSGSPTFRRCESSINMDWVGGGPGNGVSDDNFSVRWSGRFWFASDGLYRFTTRTDDGVRLWLDGQLLIDEWRDMASTEFQVERNLYAGTHTLRLDYYEHGGYAAARLSTQILQGGHDPDDGRTIGYDAGQDGSVDPSGDRDDYYFDGAAGQDITIRLDKRDSDLDTYVELYNPDGSLLGQDDDGGSGLNSWLAITLQQNGRHQIVARGYGSSTGGYRLNLSRESTSDADDNRWIAFGGSLDGTISPTDDRDWYYFSGTAGRVVSIQMDKVDAGLDSFLELYDNSGTKIYQNDDGGGDLDAWLVYTLPASGVYRIMARSWNLSSAGRYNLNLDLADNSNLARGQGAWATSTEFYGVEPYKATDGRMDTRWSSEFSDPQLIYVDLGSVQTFDQVVLRWETAYAQRYGIYYWDGSDWQNMYWTNSGNGGNDTITFAPVQAQFVGMYGVERGTSWGYSLWEFEVYNVADALIPTVPPDPGGKPPEDGVDPMLPLPPNDPSKPTILVGEGPTGQEDTPLPGVFDGAPAFQQFTIGPNAYILYPGSATSARLQDTILFHGLAVDNDEDGESIVAYEWRSDLDGMLGATATFTLSASSLTQGTHLICFRAQDNEGNWSDEASTELAVGVRYVYLPIVMRNNAQRLRSHE